MKLGFCTSIDNLELVEKAGIDYMESSVGAVAGWTDEETKENLKKLANSPVKFESCNSLIGGFSLYEDADWSKTDAYFARVLPRLAEVGMKTLVFGSGGYRRIIDGVTPEAAHERILQFLDRLSGKIKPYGITIVIEPLNTNECNILTSSKEAEGYVRELNLPNIQLLVDYYHFLLESERLTVIDDYKGILKHTHIANPVKRFTPAPFDGVDYVGWFRALKKIGYDGLIVAEPRRPDDLFAAMQGYKAAMDMAMAEAGV
ncbi:MAG: sugar phosphate isomerase/epimerase [Clostridia bacterium]|nr:sugar phosphate isomerase/epimerase [Clostridia bacterium]